jgi:hypothetical protein
VTNRTKSSFVSFTIVMFIFGAVKLTGFADAWWHASTSVIGAFFMALGIALAIVLLILVIDSLICSRKG